MGRIHRYGQREDCLIFNFAATNTIEGRVLRRLLDKLQEIRDALDDFYRARIVDGLGQTVHERLFAVETDHRSDRHLREPGLIGNIVPAEAPEALPEVATAPEPAAWLHRHALAPFLEDTRWERLTEIGRVASHVELSLTELLQRADEGKAERYGEMGVRELWRLHGRKGTRELCADFLALRTGSAPRQFGASEVLEGLTPDDVCEAVEGVEASQTYDERTEAVARIVRRRRQASVRVREEAAAYSVH